ncbi:MAG: DNA polymerase III subunit delta' [Deltaproteobacteria bacterium]|nr:DNA polymerase III subunit delta' [Deltaproteobacteria bacterium]
MSFSEVLGQAQAIEVLQRERSHERIPHAYLFCGPDGVGKKRTAFALAQSLQCETGGVDGCGDCPACRKVAHDRHPDVHFYQPVARTKGAMSKIYIDQIRELQGAISLKAMEGRKKIMIVDDADRMVDQAANALLKTLEEPPGDSLLILIATFPDLLPSTILSRSRKVRFRPLSDELVTRVLMRERGMTEEGARTLARFAQGSLSRVMEVEPEDLLTHREEFLKESGRWKEGDLGAVFDFCARFAKNSGDAVDFIHYLLEWTRDLIALKLQGPEGVLIYRDRIPDLEAGCRGTTVEDLLEQFDRLQGTLKKLDRNVNPRLALEIALSRLVA